MSNNNNNNAIQSSSCSCSKTAEWLRVELESGSGSGSPSSPPSSSSSPSPPSSGLLLLDCRAHELYESSHIESAIHLAVPGLLLRRFRRRNGSLPIRTIISNPAHQERFVARCKTDTVVVYDECSTTSTNTTSTTSNTTTSNTSTTNTNSIEWRRGGGGGGEHGEQEIHGTSSSPSPSPSPGSLLGLLLQKLRDDGCQAYYLHGGFVKFQTEYPEHCETPVDSSSSCPSSSPSPLSALGFGSLCVSSDCSDGGSESDRELPGSATESEGSPGTGAGTGSQPAFPVQILPYLYLGCAKDSTNLDVLGQHNIKYILNVTPNLPNVFEHEGHFRYKQIPISDHWSQNLSQFFPEAISFIDEARSKQCGVLVHCLAGISRSVTVTVAYLMRRLDLSLNDAYDFVKRKKSNISPNFNFMGQLLDFERTLGRLHSPGGGPCDDNSCPGGSAGSAGSGGSGGSGCSGSEEQEEEEDEEQQGEEQQQHQLFFTTPTNHSVFQLDTSLEST